MVSAIKVDGQRLHALARAGQEVERAPRRVRIDAVVVEGFVAGDHPRATILVRCGSGTYVRSLAADLGAALGGPAHLGSLRRLRVGAFDLDDAHTLEAIEADPDAALLDPATAMRALAAVDLEPGSDAAVAVAHGAPLPGSLADGLGEGPFAVRSGGALIAVYERRGEGLRPAVVVPADE